MKLVILSGGKVQWVYQEVLDLSGVGDLVDLTRVSRIEPDSDGNWLVETNDGYKLGPYSRRSEALAAEVAHVESRLDK